MDTSAPFVVLIISLFVTTVRSGAPILIAVVGELFAEKSGVLNMSVEGMLWGIVIGIVCILPIFFKLSFENYPLNNYSKDLSKRFLLYGFPLVATNLAAWVLALSDRYMIEYYRGSHEVGLYSISYSLADRSILLIVSLLIITSQPIVMSLWENKGASETMIFIRDMTKLFLIITLPAVVGLSLLSETIIKLLAPKEYLDGYRIIPMVAASIFLFGLQRNFQLVLLFYKKTKLIMFLVLIAGFINVISNILLIEIWQSLQKMLQV